MIEKIVLFYNTLFILYSILISVIYMIIFLYSIIGLYIYSKKRVYIEEKNILKSEFAPGISILVPAYNESAVIENTIKSLMSIEYSKYEIIVINDGSTDNSLQEIIDKFQMVEIKTIWNNNIKTAKVKRIYISKIYEGLILVDKENGGKADSLNAGVNISNFPLVVSIDADTIIENKSLLKVVKPFVDNFDKTAVAGGTIMIINGSIINDGYIEKVSLPKDVLSRFQVIEYLRAFIVGRVGFSVSKTLLIVSGAFAVFNKSIIEKVGGFNTKTVGEDMEIIIRIHKYIRKNKLDKKIYFTPDPVSWTQAPEDLESFIKQRQRWQRGLLDSILIHSDIILKPKYGFRMTLSYLYFVFFELLEPPIFVTGISVLIFSVITDTVYSEFFLVMYLASTMLSIFLSLFSIILAELIISKYYTLKEYFILVVFAFLENLGYRQLNSMIRFLSIFKYKYKKNNWDKFARKI